jgi:hypothetical protein
MLPDGFAETRAAVRALACYAIAPARRAATGRIGLRAVVGRIATPPFDDGSRISVDGTTLRWGSRSAAITTVRSAAEFLGVELSADPGVGSDLPPFTPDEPLLVDEAASHALGEWYGFGQGVIDGLSGAEVTEAQLWPEHFDLATVATVASGAKANVGFSAGDGFSAEPYVYVGPHEFAGPDGDYWNAPFGAVLRYSSLGDDRVRQATAFVEDGLRRL